MLRPLSLLFDAMWATWLLYWALAALRAKPTERRESIPSRIGHIAPLILAATLVAAPRLTLSAWGRPLWHATVLPFVVGALLTAAGLLFTVWARVHIGRNWSGTVTIKHSHELITSGPYAWVRHPIYTGLILAFLGSALARGTPLALLAPVIVWASFWRKLRLEERWMREHFGPAYQQYERNVPALLPRLPAR